MSASTAARPARTLLARLSATVAAALALGAAPATAAATGNWVMTGWNIHQLNQLSPAVASHFFNTPASYATGPNTAATPVSDGFATASVLVYNSYAQFAADIASHAIAPAYTWVMYDLEYWAQTPLAEQQNPAAAMRQFGQLAHAHGLKVIEAPGRDLGLVPGAACPQARENLDHWYLRCDIPGAEVSTTYGTATQMATAAKSANADGIYINATTRALGKTRSFLRLMQKAGY